MVRAVVFVEQVNIRHFYNPLDPDVLFDLGEPGRRCCVKQAIVRATGPVLVPSFLPGGLSGATRRGTTKQADGTHALDTITPFVLRRIRDGATNLFDEVSGLVEKQLLTVVLEQVHGNSSQACRILGISRPTLRAKLAAHGLSVKRSAHLDAIET